MSGLLDVHAPAPAERKYVMGWEEFYDRVAMLCLQLKRGDKVYGVPRGGNIVAAATGRAVSDPDKADAVVDDIIDSGRTRDSYAKEQPGKPFLALVDKQGSPADAALGWVVFPWEVTADNRVESGPEDAVRRILQYIGENPDREGLVDTPKRVLKAWQEITAGNLQDPGEILARDFDGAGYDEMVVLRNVGFHSTCEHHLLPFTGVATVAYIPTKRVVGLSKLARLVDCYARRLQIQEQMTRQIVTAIQTHLEPQGAAVQLSATHACMTCRGVKKEGAQMVTTALTGAFRTQPETRAEFLAACRS